MTFLGGLGQRHLGARAADLLDGRLSPDAEAGAWAHVQECGTCHEQVMRESWVKRSLSGLAPSPAPSGPAAPASLRRRLGVISDLPTSECVDLGGPPVRSRRALVALSGGAVGIAMLGVVAVGVSPAYTPAAERRVSVTSSQSRTSPLLPASGAGASVSRGSTDAVSVQNGTSAR